MALVALAYLAAHGQADRVASASVTNTLIDFGMPGDLGIFTDEDTIARLEKRMNERGYLESAEMARTFDWMRSSDLIWSYVVNNWFKGKQPPAENSKIAPARRPERQAKVQESPSIANVFPSSSVHPKRWSTRRAKRTRPKKRSSVRHARTPRQD